MRAHVVVIAWWAIVLAVWAPHEAWCWGVDGFASVEGRAFPAAPIDDAQRRHSASLVLQPEISHRFAAGVDFSLIPFVRLDSADDERTHADVRECLFLYSAESYDLRFGIGRVFWGATEFLHLIDIINQTDSVESLDGEDKLGQPLLQLSLPLANGAVDFFLLPWFRERTFAGPHGRLRALLPVDTGKSRYESAAGQAHLDLAARYGFTLGSADLGLAWFHGTDREPLLLPEMSATGVVLVPWYRQISQGSVDMQAAAGDWLWKLEALYRSGQGEAYSAATGGIEYSFYGLAGSVMDLGVIVEFCWDERQERATSFAENDFVIGVRLALNDPADTSVLLAVVQDLDGGARMWTVEAGRRVSDRLKVQLEGAVFAGVLDDFVLGNLRQDDFLRLEVLWYF